MLNISIYNFMLLKKVNVQESDFIILKSITISYILKTLYDRYVRAEEILTNNDDIKKIMVIGGCRAYLDAFSDYMNPLLIEMDKAEKMLSNMNVKK